MNRRRVLAFMAAMCLFAPGCNESLWGNWNKKKVEPYATITNGMTEKQVVKALGEPSRRNSLNLEGNGPRATILTWVGHSQLINVTMVGGQVVSKQKF